MPCPQGWYRTPQDDTGATKLKSDVSDQVSNLFSTGTVRPVRVEEEAALPDSLLVGWGAVVLSLPVHHIMKHQHACSFSHSAKQHKRILLQCAKETHTQCDIACSRMTLHMCHNSFSTDAQCSQSSNMHIQYSHTSLLSPMHMNHELH